ncbi:hypothetical protein J4416_03590 [Candidatus Pacearchaeota archaeon]|nr:hypothetical protein [Candidatus Pacearchaeota archaeon]
MVAKLLVVGTLVFLAVVLGMFLFIDSSNKGLSEATGLVVNSESFPTYLETHPIISNLPKDASIGIKMGSASYEVRGHAVYLNNGLEGKEDITFSLPEGYESVIGEIGLCGAVRKAYKNDEISFETHSSKIKLFFKYRKLLKYSDCIN